MATAVWLAMGRALVTASEGLAEWMSRPQAGLEFGRLKLSAGRIRCLQRVERWRWWLERFREPCGNPGLRRGRHRKRWGPATERSLTQDRTFSNTKQDRTVEDEDERPNTPNYRTVEQGKGRADELFGRAATATVRKNERALFGRALMLQDERSTNIKTERCTNPMEVNEVYKPRGGCTNPMDEVDEVYKPRGGCTNPMEEVDEVYKPRGGCTNPMEVNEVYKPRGGCTNPMDEVDEVYKPRGGCTNPIDEVDERAEIPTTESKIGLDHCLAEGRDTNDRKSVWKLSFADQHGKWAFLAIGEMGFLGQWKMGSVFANGNWVLRVSMGTELCRPVWETGLLG
ncbi:hypothetical protein LR48_Vigan232s001000 [Vigna angularis]|uniref:Uncharacterized protein n=1 Tax=Phaseolus angularis TaxID=3914 RepID=A0A0L9T6B7_PHAAN|nr:hypothetical protein LR48_Vigan232s001000 [Vigna angularis]